MNNSDLSATSSSADTFTDPRTYLYPPSWNSAREKLSTSGTVLHDEHRSNAIAEIEQLPATTESDGPEEETQSRPEATRSDLGLWLLSGSAIRYGQWERLRGTQQSAAAISGFGLEMPSCLIKRSCDIVGAAFLLGALAPLFALISILIKLDSPGPVFFRHHRVGKDGKIFVLWKFRSMRTDVPKYEASPRSATDVRLTRFGRLIRRMSIDEIPQLVNVLKGEMSLVGPRPEMPFIVARYHSVRCERFFVRPGITGLWQISPARAFPIHENLQYDLHYVRNQNFILDCAIIVRTITAVIHGVGAV